MKTRTALVAGALGAAVALSGLAPALAAPGARMTGGGWVAVGNPNEKVHVRVGLRCPGEAGVDPTNPNSPAALELRGRSSSFSLDRIVSAFCQNNLFEGSGVGTCNGVGGFIIDWRLTDGGLGGPDTREDRVEVDVRGAVETCGFAVAGALGGGNLTLHGG